MGFFDRFRRSAPAQPGVPEALPWPKEIQFSLTAYCNLACVMCPREADWIPEGFTRLADEDKEVERFAKLLPLMEKAHHLTLTGGGEPFLDPALFPILEMCDRFPGLNVSFNTNATLATPARVERAFSHRIAQLDISMDSPVKATYEAIRLNSSYEKVLKGIRNITAARDKAAHKPRLSINMVVMRRNLHEIPEMLGLAHALGIDSVCALYSQIFKKDLMPESLAAVPRDEVQAVLEDCHNIAEELGITFHDLIAEPLGIPLFGNPDWETRISKLCRYPWDNLYVFSNGNVRFCCFTSPVLGNLDRQSFEEIWTGPKADQVRRMIAGDQYPGECRSCYRWGPDKFQLQGETPGLELDKAMAQPGRGSRITGKPAYAAEAETPLGG